MHVHHNTIDDLPERNAIYLDGWTGANRDLEIYCNRIDGVGGEGIMLNGERGGVSDGIRIYNNVISNINKLALRIGGYWLKPMPRIQNVHIYNNTICKASNTSFECRNTNTENIQLVNNILANAGSSQIDIAGNGVAHHHNLCWGRSPNAGPGDIVADPKFVDPDKGDFRLRNGSPAINAGTADSAPAVDCNGVARLRASGVTIGAYQPL